MLRKVEAAIDSLNDAVGRWVRWLVLAMVLIGAYNALARYLTRFTDLSLASNAYIDLQWYLFSLVFLLGAAYGLRVDAHVRVDVLYQRASARVRAWIDLLGTLLFLVPFCLLMLWVSFPAVRASWAIREGSPDPGGLPRYPIKAVILAAFALLLLQGFSQAVKAIRTIRSGDEGAASAGPDAEPSGPDVGASSGAVGAAGAGAAVSGSGDDSG